MSRRAFTLAELAICLSVAALITPIVFHFGSALQDQHAIGLWHLQSADGVRTFAEELRLDAHRPGRLADDGVGWTDGSCEIRYRVTDARVLVRDAPADCGGSRAIATDVQTVSHVPGGVEVTFLKRLRPDRETRATVFLPVEGR